MTELIQESTLAEYEAFVQSHPKGHFAQSSLWAKQKPAWKWRAIVSRGADGRIRGSIAFLIRTMPYIHKTMLYACRGPVCDLDDRETFGELVAAARELAKEYKAYVIKIDPDCAGREADSLLSTGEQVSVSLCALALARLGVPAVSLCGWQMGLQTDGSHGSARVLGLRGDRIERELRAGRVVLAAGFQGVDGAGDITTLGRGGSDTTAVALAAFLHADLCRIYTDVDGVYDRDPRLHPDAVKYGRISYDDMLLLARGGARVLHDRCVELARREHVVLEVCSAFSDAPGTIVG